MSHDAQILAVRPVGSSLALPTPKVPIRVRPATMADLAFFDALQKKQSKQVGFIPTGQLEQTSGTGEVLVACCGLRVAREDGGASSHLPATRNPQRATPVGYPIACDRYFKRDDCGIIYALNILPEFRRSFVAMTLLKAQFDRSTYERKLYCRWCAQDIDATKF